MKTNETKVIAIANQKGGVGKTTTTLNLGVGLKDKGYRVLMIDTDPQGSLTLSCGITAPEDLDFTLSTVMASIIKDTPFDEKKGIITTSEGVDLMPCNVLLSGIEIEIVNVMCREMILSQYIDMIRENYDYILIDCMPSLGTITVNALAAADCVLIPSQANYLSVKGFELLLGSIGKIRKQVNKKLYIAGILITMVDVRTNLAKDVSKILRNSYGQNIKIFDTVIPLSVKAQETPNTGKSIYKHAKSSKVAKAYREFTEEFCNK